MKKKITTAALLMCMTGVAHADLFDIAVSADTYIRNDGAGPNSKNDGDTDNEIIIGINGSSSAELNGLLRFDLSSILALGDPGDITINSVTLTGTTRDAGGSGTNVNINVHDYGFEFVEVDATYNDPDGDGNAGTGDTTAGGTLGTLLSSQLIADPSLTDTSYVFADSAAFRSALSTQLAGDGTLNLLLRGSGVPVSSFVRFSDEDRPNPFTLNVDASVALSPGNVFEDFEGSTANSSTPPAGWVLVDTAAPNNATYATSALGAGSNGSGGNDPAGLAGRVSSPDFGGDSDISGAYLYNTTNFDTRLALTGSFDFQAVNEATFDDITFMFGAIADGLQDTSDGEMITVKIGEGSIGAVLSSGVGVDNRIDQTGTSIVDDTWYHAEVTWTPTSDTTGDFVITVSDFSGDLYTLTASGFTYDIAIAQIGFGSVNDTIMFDNVNFNQVPEPTSLALFGLGGLLLSRRRRS